MWFWQLDWDLGSTEEMLFTQNIAQYSPSNTLLGAATIAASSPTENLTQVANLNESFKQPGHIKMQNQVHRD